MLKLVKKGRVGENSAVGNSINSNELESQVVNGESWCVKYTPANIKDLAMHHSKIKAIRDWLVPVVDLPGKYLVFFDV